MPLSQRSVAARGAREALLEGSQTEFSLEIRQPLDSESDAWDTFVLKHRHGSPFHLMAWKKTIEESFHYRPFYLLARDGAGIRAVLPMFLVKNPLVGRALISSPFAVYGGILAETDEARRALHAEAQRSASCLHADYVELRNAYSEQCVAASNVSRYVTFTRLVGPDRQAMLASLPQKTRNTVRKSLNQQLAMRYAVKDLAAFDAVHSRNMHRIGTLTLPIHYLRNLMRYFGPMVDIREVVFENKIVIGVSLSFLYRDQMHTYYASTDAQYNHLAPNSFMYFDHLCWAGANGYEVFDFGRSKREGGVYEFKKRWGTSVRELPYEILLTGRRHLPKTASEGAFIPLFTALWQKLPLPLARRFSRLLLPLFP
jgi:FemAB-related protein (PEP-CTERM system-associated)